MTWQTSSCEGCSAVFFGNKLVFFIASQTRSPSCSSLRWRTWLMAAWGWGEIWLRSACYDRLASETVQKQPVVRWGRYTLATRDWSAASGILDRTHFLTRCTDKATFGDERRSFPFINTLTLGLKSNRELCRWDERNGKSARWVLKCSAQTKSLCTQLSLCQCWSNLLGKMLILNDRQLNTCEPKSEPQLNIN